MVYTHSYDSSLGRILMAADGEGLCGLWFEGQRHCAASLDAAFEVCDLPIFRSACLWLYDYFAGKCPAVDIPLHPIGTAFQLEVWSILSTIPYGTTVTYGEIADRVAARRGLARMSAQAVGGAVGRNPISIMVPCHRVLGADGSLIGYAGGLRRKRALLALEGISYH